MFQLNQPLMAWKKHTIFDLVTQLLLKNNLPILWCSRFNVSYSDMDIILIIITVTITIIFSLSHFLYQHKQLWNTFNNPIQYLIWINEKNNHFAIKLQIYKKKLKANRTDPYFNSFITSMIYMVKRIMWKPFLPSSFYHL